MRIVFMGTPDIAERALDTLLAEKKHEVVAVYTRRDKPVGRKQVLTPPPVKVRALEAGIPVQQPKTLRTEDAAATLAIYRPDIVVVVAYGLILPPDVLAVPRYGCINLHVSLLPKYRGAAPIQWAVINGEKQTGVSIMQMDEGLDTGAVLAERAFDILPNATAEEVFDQATAMGAQLLLETLQAVESGTAKAVPQSGEPSFAPQLDKKMAQVDFALPAQQLHNLARGCYSWPLAWFESAGKRIKLTQTRVSDAQGALGQIVALDPLTVACGQGALELHSLVPEGSREMKGREWAAGRRFKVGDSVL